MSSVPYKTVLVLGATSGIGLALAEKFIANGSHVIAVGRRQEKLDDMVAKHGKDKVSAIKFDITNLEGIPGFAEKVLKSHPKLDSIMFNSGIQRGLDFTKPESIDPSKIDLEFTANYFSYIYLLKQFLPHFLSLPAGTPRSLYFVSSGLGLVPLLRCGNYSASKAALHHLVLVLRQKMSDAKQHDLKIVEIYPPAVQTELHDEKHQPDIKNGGQIGMPLAEFTTKTWDAMCQEKDDIPIGTLEPQFKAIEVPRRKEFDNLNEMMKKGI